MIHKSTAKVKFPTLAPHNSQLFGRKDYGQMKLTNHSAVPVYTISGSSTARPLPEWLARKRRRSLKQDPEYANRIELLQDFEFEEASQCIRVSDDGDWVMSTGKELSKVLVGYV